MKTEIEPHPSSPEPDAGGHLELGIRLSDSVPPTSKMGAGRLPLPGLSRGREYRKTGPRFVAICVIKHTACCRFPCVQNMGKMQKNNNHGTLCFSDEFGSCGGRAGRACGRWALARAFSSLAGFGWLNSRAGRRGWGGEEAEHGSCMLNASAIVSAGPSVLSRSPIVHSPHIWTQSSSPPPQPRPSSPHRTGSRTAKVCPGGWTGPGCEWVRLPPNAPFF